MILNWYYLYWVLKNRVNRTIIKLTPKKIENKELVKYMKENEPDFIEKLADPLTWWRDFMAKNYLPIPDSTALQRVELAAPVTTIKRTDQNAHCHEA